jgi:prophage tail gpP-like protein
VQAEAFGNIPHKLTVGGRTVRVAWFRYMSINTVLLTMADRDDLVLLVVPPLAPAEAAAQALRAASGPGAVMRLNPASV